MSLSGLCFLFLSLNTYCCICGGNLPSLALRFFSLVSSTVGGMYLALGSVQLQCQVAQTSPNLTVFTLPLVVV